MANNPSDLIQFKRGSMANLETLIANKSGIDGTFYLTIDDDASGSNNPSKSSRLFVGRADGSIVPVNQGIITVEHLSDLTNNITGKWHAGDYAYVTDSNILAIYDGKTWKQINAVGEDTYVDIIAISAASVAGGATVTTTATMNDGTTKKADAFSVTGAGSVTVSTTGNKDVVVTGKEYALSSAAPSSNAATVALTSNNGATAEGSVTISSANGSDLTITGNANQIVLTPADMRAKTIAISNETNGFGVQVTNGDGTFTNKATVDPVVKYGENAGQTAHFDSNGELTLDVYTKDEIDAQKIALNAMVYKGTVGTGGSAATSVGGITSASIGDTFKLMGTHAETYTITTASGTQTVHGGDLIIANSSAAGTAQDPKEDENGLIPTNKLYFDWVPAGDDIDSRYGFTGVEHGVQIIGTSGADNGTSTGQLKLANTDGLITLADTGTGNSKTITLGHGSITTGATTGTAISQLASGSVSVAAVTGVTTDGHGHVSSVETTNVTLTDTNATLSSVTNTVTAGTGNDAGKKVSIKTEAVLTHSNGTTIDTEDDSFDIVSDNLTITASGKQVQANFLWGTF